MVQEARDLAAFFMGKGAEDLAGKASDLAAAAEAAGYLSITNTFFNFLIL